MLPGHADLGLSPRLLRYFLAVVEHGGVTNAAEELYVAQPSVSQALRQLEKVLGVKLFERIGQRLVLTDVGEAFISPARQALEAIQQAEEVATSAQNLGMGRVRLTALPSLVMEPVPRICAEFRQQHPQVTVVADMTFTAAECYQAVRGGDVDLALTVKDEDVAVNGVHEERVGAMMLFLTAPPGTSPATAPLRPSELSQHKFIAGRPGTWTRELLDRLVDNGHDLSIAVDATSRDIVVPLVLSGVGSAFVAPQYARLAAQGGAIVHQLDPKPARDIVLVRRPTLPSPAVEAFAQLVLNSGKLFALDRHPLRRSAQEHITGRH